MLAIFSSYITFFSNLSNPIRYLNFRISVLLQ